MVDQSDHFAWHVRVSDCIIYLWFLLILFLCFIYLWKMVYIYLYISTVDLNIVILYFFIEILYWVPVQCLKPVVTQSPLATKKWTGPVKFDPGQVRIIIDYIRRDIFLNISWRLREYFSLIETLSGSATAPKCAQISPIFYYLWWHFDKDQ